MSTLREEFEAWAKREGTNLWRHPERPEQYANTAVQGRWLAYQAATERAAKLCEEEAGCASFVNNMGASLAAEQCAAAIRSTGGKGS